MSSITIPRVNLEAIVLDLDNEEPAYMHRELQHTAGLTLREAQAVTGAIVTARALGSRSASTTLEDGTRVYATRLGLGSARYRVAFRDEDLEDCGSCAAPAGHRCIHWCTRTRTADELDQLAHVHVERDSSDCDGRYSDEYVRRFEELGAADTWTRAVLEVVSPSAVVGELKISTEPARTWDGYPTGRELPSAEWREQLEEGGLAASLTLCYREGCSA